mmetsp:Transcript_29511/g.47447  ORF Transcript_29511/g.47447 Transcript_29511/m.47447 type:complete len:209 (-) Transcript_29511:87-713(-)
MPPRCGKSSAGRHWWPSPRSRLRPPPGGARPAPRTKARVPPLPPPRARRPSWQSIPAVVRWSAGGSCCTGLRTTCGTRQDASHTRRAEGTSCTTPWTGRKSGSTTWTKGGVAHLHPLLLSRAKEPAAAAVRPQWRRRPRRTLGGSPNRPRWPPLSTSTRPGRCCAYWRGFSATPTRAGGAWPTSSTASPLPKSFQSTTASYPSPLTSP